MRRPVAVTGLSLLTAAGTAWGDLPASPPARPAPALVAATPAMAAPPKRRAARPKPKPKAAEVPQVPDADVVLAIEAPAQRGPWTIRLTNDGDVPVTVAADARLLTFDVTPRSAPKPQHCELPGDMRPADTFDRALVLPPHRAYVEIFEPRLYCFAGKALDALASGAIVVARLGRTGTSDAGVVAPIDGVEPIVLGRRFIEAAPIALPDEASPPRPNPVDRQPDALALSLNGTTSIDAESPEEVEIPLTLRNEGSRPLLVRFRPEMLSFDIVGPSGVERCSWPVLPAAPMRELYTPLPAKSGIAHLTVLLGTYCFGHVLDEEGLLAVWPRLDTRQGSGESLGLHTFNGQIVSPSPTFIRLHRGRVSEPIVRPRLEDR